jgi:hypothetical protein
MILQLANSIIYVSPTGFINVCCIYYSTDITARRA